ncbi:unnamed protein product [Cyclocybe aegerita]|uniref:Uncharacterized protein n=1 Tax=Cyclocybe aegerita TaxID=1973307 RepID=A0A8S0XI42_CYCAE|nr:unnamed protein product [Cyclocybe aegerita]
MTNFAFRNIAAGLVLLSAILIISEQGLKICRGPSQRLDMTTNELAGGPLASWVATRLKALYEVPAPASHNHQDVYAETFSSTASIILNHKNVTMDAFKKELEDASSAIKGASVDWKELVETPSDDSSGGIVAGFFVVTRSMKFRIRAGPAQRLSYNVFSAKVATDGQAPGSDSGEGCRQITELFITHVDKAAPIHLHAIDAGISATAT